MVDAIQDRLLGLGTSFTLIRHAGEIRNSTISVIYVFCERILTSRSRVCAERGAKERSCASRYPSLLIRGGHWRVYIHSQCASTCPREESLIADGSTSVSKQGSPRPARRLFRGKKMGIEVFDCLNNYLRVERCKKSYLGKPAVLTRCEFIVATKNSVTGRLLSISYQDLVLSNRNKPTFPRSNSGREKEREKTDNNNYRYFLDYCNLIWTNRGLNEKYKKKLFNLVD